ncbi:hypothetical protein NBT05_09965 [Aquimarina sp. ERC-38]|uniref:hypothetical protein n=1 Tax=Aquimarina sp. ERC-38 TaxID=2949996 RepID=UPI0022455B90|nr:hypothetical protein [Aquimarina sp. ERC-38]UZO79296.1 hypothetical protein NBT05_09965 [Aquimarina sp. ERC-38]
MKTILIYRLSILLLFLACISNLVAQKRLDKFVKTFKVEDNLTLQVNSNYSKIIIKPSEKNEVAVHAYFEGDIQKETKKELLADWEVTASKDLNRIVIQTTTAKFWAGEPKVSSSVFKKIQPEDINTLHAVIASILNPVLNNSKQQYKVNQLNKKLKSIDFDTALYIKDEKRYVEQWHHQIREKFGNNSDDLLKLWLQNLSEESNHIFLASTDLPGYHTTTTTYMDRFIKGSTTDMTEVSQYIGDTVTVYQFRRKKGVQDKVTKVLEVSVPATTQLELKVRHGSVRIFESVANVKASLAYTSLTADEITGKQSIIEISYAPIFVKKWSSGHLALNYVKNCRLQTVSNLRINSDSSNIFMQELQKNTAISGSFGTISISSLAKDFETLDLLVQNADFQLKVPKEVVFNFSLSGSQNKIQISKSVKVSARKNFENIFVSGYQNSRNTENLINIQAKYCNISLQSI